MLRAREQAVGVADLKARLSRHLRGVRRGRSITVLDHSTPIARVVPYDGAGESLDVRSATRRFARFGPSARPTKRTDSLAVLDEIRRERG